MEVIRKGTEFLARRGVESPRLQTELLLAEVLGVPRLNLYLQFERELTGPEQDRLREYVQRRGKREPLQHILGSVAFCGLDFKVSRDVLVPRPETELLAEKSWQWLNQRANPRFLDFGTGSGCLAVTLAVKCPAAGGVALDLSTAALDIARQNATRHGVAGRIEFQAGDGFAALAPGCRFDLVVSNPPYIPAGEIERLAPEVREYDPRLALDGGADGLRFYRVLAAEGPAWMESTGALLLELGDGQAEAVQTLLQAHNWIVESVEPDYSGHPRILRARRASA